MLPEQLTNGVAERTRVRHAVRYPDGANPNSGAQTMSGSPSEHTVITRPGRNCLPTGLRSPRLAEKRGTEIIRIRFSLDQNKSVDLPLTAETLEQLAQILGPFHGHVAVEMPAEVEDVRKVGGVEP